MDCWDEYRWFEIEFSKEVEMTSFMDELNERRKEKRKRGEVLRLPVGGGKGGLMGGSRLRR